MTTASLSELALLVQEGTLVPYLGHGVLHGVTETSSGTAMLADSDSLILAMNGGKPMSPRLMKTHRGRHRDRLYKAEFP